MEIVEFLETLDGVKKVIYNDRDDIETLEILVSQPVADTYEDLIANGGEWELEWREDDAPVHVRMHFSHPPHKIESMVVMTPHVVTDFDPDDDSLIDVDVGDEEASAGYHRRVDHIECACGETLSSLKRFKEHKDEP